MLCVTCVTTNLQKKHARQYVYGLSLRDKGVEKLTKIICDPKSLACSLISFQFSLLVLFNSVMNLMIHMISSTTIHNSKQDSTESITCVRQSQNS